MDVIKNASGNPELRIGDVFYVVRDGRYHPHKLLAVDTSFSCYHVLAYEALDTVPSPREADRFKIAVYHFPVDMGGFEKPVVMGNMRVLAHELIGYHEYLRQTQNYENYTPLAIEYFNEGIFFTDEHKNEEAIDAYTKAMDLIPLFYEAIDNRAFCKMNLALWDEAINDFHQSLEVNPVSVLAEFSIGECYLKMKRYPEARAQFEKALAIDPGYQLAKDFLEHVNTLL